MNGVVSQVQCPCCFELVEVWFEVDVQGALVQDCEVCCRPWELVVRNGEVVRCEPA